MYEKQDDSPSSGNGSWPIPGKRPRTFAEYTRSQIAETHASLPVCCGGWPEMLSWDFVPRCSICDAVFTLSLPPALLSELKLALGVSR